MTRLALLDINPVAEGHTQVIPKCKSSRGNRDDIQNITFLDSITDHARTIGELPDEYLSDIGPILKKIALATGAEQYNILQVWSCFNFLTTIHSSYSDLIYLGIY